MKKNMDQCIDFLCESDIPYGEAKGRVKYLDKKLKVIKAQAFLKAEGTGEQRKAISEIDPDHLAALEEYKNACLDMETLGVQRETINIRVEIWRTNSANQRKGNI
jgi:hypothetical protein